LPAPRFCTCGRHACDGDDRIIPDDVKKDAAIIAAAVWHAANRDQMIPRFTKETMPAPVEPR
jgi:hypothetical protein